MGPRLVSRGNEEYRLIQFEARALQWGRGSSAAETSVSPQPLLGYLALQWGRGSSAAETLRTSWRWRAWSGFNGAAARQPRKRRMRVHCPALGGIASMGPRLVSRGNSGRSPAAHRCRRFNGAAARQPRKRREDSAGGQPYLASMGPRLVSRGNNTVTHEVYGSSLLQWGRGSSAAETPSRGRARLRPHRFNGAAARQPRKRVDRLVVVHLLGVASMGPRLVSRGNLRRPPRVAAGVRLQWGRGSSAAETWSLGVGYSETQSFNGAAARQPRKRGGTTEGLLKGTGLQWGRGSSAAETVNHQPPSR